MVKVRLMKNPLASLLFCPLVLSIVFPSGTRAQETAAGRKKDDDRCLDCHAQAHIASVPARERQAMVAPAPGGAFPKRDHPEALFVDRSRLRKSVHATVACQDCHPDAKTLPHPARLPKARCASCHEEEAAVVQRSRHAEMAMRSEPPAPGCPDCHGGHDILPPGDRNSRVYPLEVIKTCASCHREHSGEITRHEPGSVLVASYLDSVHGRTIARAGLVVGATCAACHGHHEVLPSYDPRSRVHRSNIPETCGRCHVGIQEEFEETVHADVAREESSELKTPVCSDCHTAHHITHAEAPAFLRDIVGECGSCHEALYRTYRESYHGQVQQLGSTRAARCFDCHGAHDIRRVDDPASTLSGARRAETCGACHDELAAMSPSGRERFVRFQPHADFRDRAKNPELFWIWQSSVVLGVAAAAFWSLHWLLWFLRSLGRRLRGPPRPTAEDSACIRRFTVSQRLTHLIVVVSFLGLALTGLPLKFSETPWAAALMRLVGGAERAGLVHRLCAVLLGAAALLHIADVTLRRRRASSSSKRGSRSRSIVPSARDWRDVVQVLRWCIGRGSRPRFDRWSYWEKFDYWVAVLGVILIGGSGLVLWYPEFFAQYVSGVWINMAIVLHGYAALLAVGFFFVIHLLNAGLRWGKFPVNLAIFTGQVPEEEYRLQHRTEYERLHREGELDDRRVRPVSDSVRALAAFVATVSVALCLLLAVLIVLAVV